MLSLNGLAKNKHVTFKNSGLVLSYDQRDSTLNFAVKGYDIAVPVNLDDLEILTYLRYQMIEANNGHARFNAWENPEVKDFDKNPTVAQRISLAYYIMQSFIINSECGTRDIWKIFNGQLHHTLISYLRNRAIADELMLKYKVAIITCKINNYTITDIDRISAVFESCGLCRQNYIFYILMLLDRTADLIVFFEQSKFVLSVEEFEREKKAFIDSPQIARLCMYHTNMKLLFIVNSHRLAKFDMANELTMGTQIAYTTVRPLHSKEYSENYARRAMTNTVNRIIHAYTHYESKIRIVQDDNGDFVSLNRQFDTNSVPDLDVGYESGAYANTLTYSEDVMLEYLDSKRA